MSVLKANTLKGATVAGSITVQGEGSNTTNLQQGLAKAWGNSNAAGTTINDSFNVSTLGDTATGKQAWNLTNAMGNANYSGSATNGDATNPDGLFFSNNSTSRVDGESLQFDNGAYGDNPQRIIVVGDLA
tara:strand:- start:414 stop:803 length:390 start_codon:yes stop_codon:yes gene_type:complete